MGTKYELPNSVLDALISMVHKYPELWDESNPQYRKKNTYVQGAAWMKIKTALGSSVNKLKQEWEKLVADFRNELRNKPKFSSGSANIEWEPKFPFFYQMMFMQDKLSAENARCAGNLETLVNNQHVVPSTSMNTHNNNIINRINKSVETENKLSFELEVDSIYQLFKNMIIPQIIHLQGVRLLNFRSEVNELVEEFAYSTIDSALPLGCKRKAIKRKLNNK